MNNNVAELQNVFSHFKTQLNYLEQKIENSLEISQRALQIAQDTNQLGLERHLEQRYKEEISIIQNLFGDAAPSLDEMIQYNNSPRDYGLDKLFTFAPESDGESQSDSKH